MLYEEPKMEVTMIELKDIVTYSDPLKEEVEDPSITHPWG